MKLPAGKVQSVIPFTRCGQENSSTALESARFSETLVNKLPVNTGTYHREWRCNKFSVTKDFRL